MPEENGDVVKLPQQNIEAALIVPTHDAILPWTYEGVMWAVPNVGDNIETENAAMAELFEVVGRYLLALSNMRDCFAPGPPTLKCVKMHHNCYVQVRNFVNARVKRYNQERLDVPHITPNRRAFKIYPSRYFDQKNRFTRRWTELYLYALSQWAQMAEANTWTNDIIISSAEEMVKLPREAYRLMAVELFNVEYEQAEEDGFRLTQDEFDNYNPDHIPLIESIEHPYTAFFTEDRIRPATTMRVPLSPGVTEPGAGAGHDVKSVPETVEHRVAETVK